jgi:hypothetical protein
MAEPIAALIVRILADTSEMVTGVKNVSGQLDTLENRVMKFGKALAGYFTVTTITQFATAIIREAGQIDAAAKRVGAGAEEFQRFAFAIKGAGVDASAAEQNIATLNARLGANDTGLLNVLRKLNIHADEFRAKDPVQRYIDLGAAISRIADPAEQAALRVEALGAKGEKALAAIDEAFRIQAENAAVYSAQDIEALKSIGDAMDRLEAKAKVTAATVLLAFGRVAAATAKGLVSAPTSDTGGSFGDAKVGGYDPRYVGPGVDLEDLVPPRAPKDLPAALNPLGGIDPNDANALSLAYADLALQAIQVANAHKEAKEQFDATNWILKTLKMEVPSLATEMGKLMDVMGTSTKVDNFTNRIIEQARRIAELTAESERLMEVINPGSTRLAGDDVDAEIFKLRSDPRNWITSGPDAGFLTPQALEIEHRLINNFNLRAIANSLTPARAPGLGALGAQFPGGPAPGGATHITINAQGGLWDSPDRMNQMARLIEDSIARRSGLSNTFTRR